MKLKNTINSTAIFAVFVAMFVFGARLVWAAPMPEQLVINQETTECGVYWGGDEFSQYALPTGWTIYRPKENLVLETPYGTCNNFDFRNQGACCSHLGLTNVGRIPTSKKVVSSEEEKLFIIDNNTTPSNTIKIRGIAILVLSVFVVVFGFKVFKKYRNKKNLPSSLTESNNPPKVD